MQFFRTKKKGVWMAKQVNKQYAKGSLTSHGVSNWDKDDQYIWGVEEGNAVIPNNEVFFFENHKLMWLGYCYSSHLPHSNILDSLLM